MALLNTHRLDGAGALDPKPLLLGWSPAVAAVGAVLFTAAVAIRCAGDPPRLISMLVYGLSMVALYVGSAAYHLGDWPAARRLYTLGALIYARRWPDPLPRILGHHELFHLLVAAAGAAFATAIWFWVIPHSRR